MLAILAIATGYTVTSGERFGRSLGGSGSSVVGEPIKRWVNLAVAGRQLGSEPAVQTVCIEGRRTIPWLDLKTGGYFDASLTCLCGQVFLGEGHQPYRQPSRDPLSMRK